MGDGEAQAGAAGGILAAEPAVFVPVKGGWGKGGGTNVHLRPAKVRSVRLALMAAWRNVAPKDLAGGFLLADREPARPALPSNKGMKLTRLSAAPRQDLRCRLVRPPSQQHGRTALQLIPGVLRTAGLRSGGQRD